MELPQLEKEIMVQNKRLTAKLIEQRGLVVDAADAERNYRVALKQEVLKLKSEGMAATLSKDISRGTKHIADLKFERDVAHGICDSCKEAIRAIRGAMSGIQSLVSVEKAKMNLL